MTGGGGTSAGAAGTNGGGGTTSSGAAGTSATSGSAGTTGAAGTGPSTGTAGTTGTTGAAGTTGTTGTAGTTGTTGRGGAAGTSAAGTSGGAAGRGGAGGGTAGTGAAGTSAGGTIGTGVTVSSTCKIPTWPTATGSQVNVSGTMSVSGVYDGKMALHEGTLNDCSTGDQSSTKPMFDIADGGTVKNVIFGNKVGDGIHCEGSCTIDNVWFPYVCDDAVTMLGGSGKTATISNSGFKNARDKTIQHNGEGSTVVITNVYIDTAGKLYRSCGQGCSSSAKRTVKVSNVVAIAVNQVVGVSTNDTATLSNICGYRTPTVCKTYQPGSDTDSTIGANSTAEGPSTNCVYKASDTHALVNDVTGALQTDVMCTGPNSAKDGSTATACVSGFETCVKGCAPGSFGFKQINCSGSMYANSGTGCRMPADATIAAHFSSANAAGATTTVSNNTTCTTEWAWGTDGSGKYCVCVPKPGYYQQSTSSWWVWDCQSQWW